MKNFFNSFLDLIFKKKCYFCGKSKASLKMCPECFDKLEFNDYSKNRVINGINVYCAGYYTKNLQKMIRGLKYHKQYELAYYQAKFMYNYFCRIDDFKNKDFLLIPVPLHTNRIKKRKYNHMELVCIEFAKLSGFDFSFKLIKRVKDTKPQYKLSRKERLSNLANAFTVDNTTRIDKPLLLIDDICTTGATFEEMSKTLLDNGYNDITCFATTTPMQ